MAGRMDLRFRAVRHEAKLGSTRFTITQCGDGWHFKVVSHASRPGEEGTFRYQSEVFPTLICAKAGARRHWKENEAKYTRRKT